jgi:hypothetical protein
MPSTALTVFLRDAGGETLVTLDPSLYRPRTLSPEALTSAEGGDEAPRLVSWRASSEQLGQYGRPLASNGSWALLTPSNDFSNQ